MKVAAATGKPSARSRRGPDREPPSRPTSTSLLDRIPFGLHELPEARPLRPDWVITEPILAGMCGSDAKLVLGDFSEGDMDNPMSAFSSLPNVPGHEVVTEVVELGPEPRRVEVGQRVVLNPWLTCGPRGIDPAMPRRARRATSRCAGASPRARSGRACTWA